MHQALQFAIPQIESVFGQGSRSLRGDFCRNEQVIEPQKNADMKRGHVDENQQDTSGMGEAAIIDHGPGGQMDAGGETEAERNSENFARPFEMEVGREEKDCDEDAALNDVGGLFQEVGAIDNRD